MGKTKRKTSILRRLLVGSGGVTLFEVMIALALFAVIVTPIMRSFITAMKVNRDARETMIATDVANCIMEGISGKSYEDVVKWLSYASATGGFDLTNPEQNKFSSINDDWYNLGHVAPNVWNGDVEPTKYAGAYRIDGVSVPDNNVTTGDTTIGLLDQQMAVKAIKALNKQATETQVPVPGTTDTSDKKLYFGFSYTDEMRYKDISAENKYGIPKLTYMLYSRIQKNNCYFDAIVTFVPRARDINLPTGESAAEYFAYEVTVTVYEYYWDQKTNTWTGRFKGNSAFDGAPAAVLKGGIMNKSIQATG